VGKKIVFVEKEKIAMGGDIVRSVVNISQNMKQPQKVEEKFYLPQLGCIVLLVTNLTKRTRNSNNGREKYSITISRI
jgi:hypothetical protein